MVEERGIFSLTHSLTHCLSLSIARRRLLNLIKTVCRPKRRCLARHKSQLSAADGKHNLHVYISTLHILSSQVNTYIYIYLEMEQADCFTIIIHTYTTTPLTLPIHTDARYAPLGVWTRLRHLANFSLMNGHG